MVLLPVAVALGTLVAPGRDAAWRDVLAEPRQWSLLGNSLALAGGTALLAVFLGVVPGVLIALHAVPCRSVLLLVLALPLAAPPYVFAIAWVDVFSAVPGVSPYGLGPAILILALNLFPIVVLLTAAAGRLRDTSLEDAARLSRGALCVFLAAFAPALGPAVLASAAIVFCLALLSFAVPSLLQLNVYTVEIYSRFNAFLDPAGAIAQALPLLFVGLVAILVLERIYHQRDLALPEPDTCARDWPLPLSLIHI